MTAHTILMALVGFNQAMNERLWNIIIEHLTDEQFVQPNTYSRGSIRDQIIHMADAQHYWLRSVLDESSLPEIQPQDYPTRAAARTVCQQSDQTFLDKLQSLSEDDLEHIPDGWTQPVWVAFMQVSHHAVDHRAQILRMLSDFGAPTFDQTFAVYMENTTPMSIDELRERVKEKRVEWDNLLQKLSPEQMNQRLMDNWTVRDAVTIVMWKERRLMHYIRKRVVEGFSFSELPQAEQAQILDANRILPLETLLAEHKATNDELLHMIRGLHENDLKASQGITGWPPDEPFWKVIGGMTWWSYPTFSTALRQLLDKA
ncbi:MAG: ClbS/DfsB family four-helix bundle protein [Anaerolineaceae bacterium]|nr:ClbS/DfsB family four-helix bundle protein [Anaerolineaceae bacterium]